MNSATPIDPNASEIEIALHSLSKLSTQVDNLVKKGQQEDLSLVIKKLKSLLDDIPEYTYDNSKKFSDSVIEEATDSSAHFKNTPSGDNLSKNHKEPQKVDLNDFGRHSPDIIQPTQDEGAADHFYLFLTALGERISLSRKKVGITQLQLSQISGLDRAYLSSIENGRQNITIGAIYKIALALQVRIEDLLVGPEN